jgi:hypothetical protein
MVKVQLLTTLLTTWSPAGRSVLKVALTSARDAVHTRTFVLARSVGGIHPKE